jgi:hypothetical protein
LVESGEDHGFYVGVELVWDAGDSSAAWRTAVSWRSSATSGLPFPRFAQCGFLRR